MNQNNYSSTLTGAPFLLFELKQAAKLKEEGFSDSEIRNQIKEQDLFQFNNPIRTRRVMASVIRRLNALDEILIRYLLTTSLENSKAINLYSIMKTDQLFKEFMTEVLEEKFRTNDLVLEKKDINLFFMNKAESHEVIANWSQLNVGKLKSVYFKLLYETGLLQIRDKNDLVPLLIDPMLKEHFISIDGEEYLRAIGESV